MTEPLVFGASTYCPTSPRTGLTGKTILRANNVILTGEAPDIYLRCYRGSYNLSETIPTLALTGTLAATVGSTTVAGTGTFFTTELRSGQQFYAGDDCFRVNQILADDSLTVYRPVTTALIGATGKRASVLFEIARQRGTLTQGNAYQLDKGSILGAGYGTLRLDGSALAGASMVLTGSPQIAIFDPTLGTYTVYDVGFDTPTVAPTVTSVAGGTKGMVAGEYSIRLVPSSSVTAGYSNPGPRANVTLVANQRMQVDVNAVAMDTAAGQDQWDVYATQIGAVQVNQGPWNFVRSVPASEIVAGIFFIEYLNAEIARSGELEFDNDPPPDAGFVATLQGYPQWVSCFGKWGGSPGPSLVPATPQNIEGAPAIWNVTSSPPEDILGVITSQARLYFLCPKTLQQGIYAPTNDITIPPTQVRPYWSMGFGNPYQLINPTTGILVGFPTGGPTRSTADVETSDDQFIGAHVAEITKNWSQPEVMVGYDPDPSVYGVCFFYPANEQNGSGWWTTRVLVWGLNELDWIGDVTIESDDRDMIVTGVATVDNALYFVAGGRIDLAGTIQQDTFQWNRASGDPVNYYAAWELQAVGVLDRNKSVKAARANGKLTSGVLQVHGFDSNQAEDLTNLELGTNAQVTVNLGTTTDVETTFRQPFNAPNNFMFCPRVSGTYNGVDEEPDRINGCVLEYQLTGVRR